jgi:predicted  nucleic acid-binding Zn-ribbon protein
MEEVISSLEREFKRVYLDIEYVSHRLDIDTSRTRNDDIPDVCSFMKRLNELENKLVSINDRTEKITSKREELFNQVVDILNDNYKTLSNVNNSMSGFKVDDVNSFNEANKDLSNVLENSHILFNSSIEDNNNTKENNAENILPNTNNRASITLLFPLPLGPTTDENLI